MALPASAPYAAPRDTSPAPGKGDLDGFRVAIVSADARFAEELAAALAGRGLSVSTFSLATLIGLGSFPEVIAFDAGTVPVDALARCRLRFDGARFLVLGPMEPRLVIQGFAAGADAWMLRSEPLDTIELGVRLVARGGAGTSRAILQYVLSLANIDSDRGRTENQRAGLSPRQFEVLSMAARGLTDQEIADRLVLSVRTVNRHMSDILSVLHCSNRNEASRVLLRGVEGGSASPRPLAPSLTPVIPSRVPIRARAEGASGRGATLARRPRRARLSPPAGLSIPVGYRSGSGFAAVRRLPK